MPIILNFLLVLYGENSDSIHFTVETVNQIIKITMIEFSAHLGIIGLFNQAYVNDNNILSLDKIAMI